MGDCPTPCALAGDPMIVTDIHFYARYPECSPSSYYFSVEQYKRIFLMKGGPKCDSKHCIKYARIQVSSESHFSV